MNSPVYLEISILPAIEIEISTELPLVVSHKDLPVEIDPVFTAWLASNPFNHLLTEESDPVFAAWLASNPFSGYLSIETDPVFSSWRSGNMLSGAKETGVDAGALWQMSLSANNLYLCTVPGPAGTAVWMKAPLVTTEIPPVVPEIYTVIFVDHDGSVLKTETVEDGKNANPPVNPTRQGYNFTGWDDAYTNITSNKTITALYEAIPTPQISLIKYGKLYRYTDIDFNNDVGIIAGMHIPSKDELDILSGHMQALYNQPPNDFGIGDHLKHPRKNGTPVLSSEYNTAAHPRWSGFATYYGRDTVKFGALPAGLRDSSGGYAGIGEAFTLLSRTLVEGSPLFVYSIQLEFVQGVVVNSIRDKNTGMSIRLVRDAYPEEYYLPNGAVIGKTIDYNGNVYDLTRIGSQVWTVQNLAATHYMDGAPLTCWDYNNDPTNTFFANESESIWK
jgi:uncharacterized protein (TIGR02145 family)